MTQTLLKRQSAARLKQIDEQSRAVDEAINALFKADPDLAAKRDPLVSIPGLSTVSAAATLLIEAPELGTLEPCQVASLVASLAASLADVAPMTQQSGQWTGRARIRAGRAHLRRALYMLALVAVRFNPDLKRDHERLTALMRQLVILANALLRDHRKWTANHP